MCVNTGGRRIPTVELPPAYTNKLLVEEVFSMQYMESEKKAVPVPEQGGETKGTATELSDANLEKVTGGGAFDNVPRVKDHDYDEDIRGRV